MRRCGRVLILSGVLAAGSLASCGDRTGLLVDDTIVPADLLDGGVDARRERDAIADVIPPLDVTPAPDANRSDCPDADATLVYVITSDYQLFSFYPPTLAFKRIGAISCPGAGPNTPFSMAVDRQGIARIVFNDGHMYRVSTATAACQSTSFQPGQAGFVTFGMGYVGNVDMPGETLYVAGDGFQAGSAAALATVDSTYVLHPIRPFSPTIVGAELTGTGGGQLFAFYANAQGSSDSYIGQIDRTTAAVVGEAHLGIPQGSGWAFAFWGGDFWIFTAPGGGGSVVTRYRPQDNSVTRMTTLPSIIDGAGVSTCAPQQ